MEKGITIYPGLDNTPEENLQLLEQAAKCGIHRVFLALMLPYANLLRAKQEMRRLLSFARKLHMDIIAALTPDIMCAFHISHLRLEAFRLMDIHTLYLKNFLPEDLAELSRNPYGIHIQFSASRMTMNDLRVLLHEHPNLRQLEAIHSGYDREGTGMFEETSSDARSCSIVRASVSAPSFRVPVGAPLFMQASLPWKCIAICLWTLPVGTMPPLAWTPSSLRIPCPLRKNSMLWEIFPPARLACVPNSSPRMPCSSNCSGTVSPPIST
ncbi:MAG: DUF871 family protein, partial [Selenomonadaceae bacterium]|nr:DUF871 family protein [Selenomonadaceae bacterium]